METDAELSLCYANPFMLEVWNRLLQNGKHMIVVSDMYLSSEVLAQMLEQNGYKGYEKLYVSFIVGSAYRGLVTKRIYNGLDTFSTSLWQCAKLQLNILSKKYKFR